MRTLLLATLVQVVLVAAAESSSSCDTESSEKCPMEKGASLLQVSANPDGGSSLLGANTLADEEAPAPAKKAAAAEPASLAANPITAAPSTAAATGNASTTDATNATTNATSASNETSEVSTTPPPATGCATKEDERAKAWFAETAAVGSPCVFGVDGDVRDEGSHCIYDNGDFGSNGWCYTAKDRSSWGSCNGLCPLYGQNQQLGAKIDNVDKIVDKVLQAVVNSTASATNVVNSSALATNAPKNEAPAPDTGKGPKPVETPALDAAHALAQKK